MSNWIYSKTYDRLHSRVQALHNTRNSLEALLPLNVVVKAQDDLMMTILVLEEIMGEEEAKARASETPKPKQKPNVGNTYTARAILSMDLPDSPFFNFKWEGKEATLQTSHVTNEQLLADEKFAGSLWKYKYTTREEIPIFMYAGDVALLSEMFDIVLFAYEFCDKDEWWVTPKMWPREQ